MKPRSPGFTTIELLVSIAIIVVLLAIAAPMVLGARERAERTTCVSQLRQLVAANHMYADQEGSLVAAAPDIFGANLRRWHGTRASTAEPFEETGSPLSSFLGEDRRIKRCPSFKASSGFEAGCGGYGYNDRGVGTRSYQFGYNEAAVRQGQPLAHLALPAETVMFVDTAFVRKEGGRSDVIEYSFAEAYRHLSGSAPPRESSIADPSIHFRHGRSATVGWSDGHVSAEMRTVTRRTGTFTAHGLGWFGKADNALFDPF